MQLVRRCGGQALRAFPGAMLTAAALFASACSSDPSGSGPVLPGNPAPNPQITRAAFLANVDVRQKTVRIAPPELTGTQNGLLQSAIRGQDSHSVDLSLVGGDVVTLTSSNFAASLVGAVTPGKVRVTFDINITNKLTGVQLVGPTIFPAPPAGTTGPLLFPFDISVAVTSGGTATGGQGNDVIVTLPSYGLVKPSVNWDGAPFNFFNDATCTENSGGGGTGGQGSGGGFGQGNATDCFRWEEFPGPIFPGSTTTPARQVGFDIDPTVGQFTARLIVAADLQNSGAAPTGTIAGVVTSPQLGTLNGVTVSATAGITTLTGTTAGAGAYSIATVPTGPASVAITGGLPNGCTNPGSQSTTVNNGATSTVNFAVTCQAPTGTVGGTIGFTGFTPSGVTGINVIVTPTGGAAQAAVNPSAAGVYSRSNVPVSTGAGAVALSNLPSGCTNPGPGSYTGLTNGGTATVNFTVACVAPPQGYAFRHTFGAVAGTSVVMTTAIDMSTFNDPAVNGTSPDDISTSAWVVFYDATRLSSPVCQHPAGAGMDGGAFNVSQAGRIIGNAFTTGTGLLTGNQVLASCTFTVIGTPVAGAATTTTITSARSASLVTLTPNVLVTEANLP